MDEVEDSDDDDDNIAEKTHSRKKRCPLLCSEGEETDNLLQVDTNIINKKIKEDDLENQSSEIQSCLPSAQHLEGVGCSCSSPTRCNHNNNKNNNNNNDKTAWLHPNQYSNNNRSHDKTKSQRKKKDPYETVIINVGGQVFETYRTTIRRLRTPIFQSKDSLQLYYRKSKGDYFFDRDPTAFGSILNFLRTGELHIPTNMCGPALQVGVWTLFLFT